MINSIVVVVGSRLKIEKQDKCPKGVGGGGGHGDSSVGGVVF